MGGYTYNDDYETDVISSMGSASTELESLKSIASGISIPSDFTYKSALEKIIADISSFDLNETINTMASSMLSFMQSEMTASELANKDGYVTYYELVAQMHQKPKQKSEYTKKEKPKKTKYEEMWDRLNKSTESARKELGKSMAEYNDYKKIHDAYTLEKGKIGLQEFFWNPIDLIIQKGYQLDYSKNPTEFNANALMKAYTNSHSKKLHEQSMAADEKYLKEMEKFKLTHNNTKYNENLRAGQISESAAKYLPLVAVGLGIKGGVAALAEGAGFKAGIAQVIGDWTSIVSGGGLHGGERGMEAATGYIDSPDHSASDVNDVAKSIEYGMKVAEVTAVGDIVTSGVGIKAHTVVTKPINNPLGKVLASGGTQAVVADVGYAANVFGTVYAASTTDNKDYFVDLSSQDVQKNLLRDLGLISFVNGIYGMGMGAADLVYPDRGVTNDATTQNVKNVTPYTSDENLSAAVTGLYVLKDVGTAAEQAAKIMDKDIYDITFAVESRYAFQGIVQYAFLKPFGAEKAANVMDKDIYDTTFAVE